MGTLPTYFDGEYSAAGIVVDLPAETTVAGIVEVLSLPKARFGMVTINGRLAKAADTVPADAEVKFFQKIAGG